MLFNTKELLMNREFKERPTYNEPFLHRGNYLNQPYDYKTIIAWIQRTPEAIGILNALVTDIISDGQTFVSPEGKALGKQVKRRVETFWRKNEGKNLMKGALYDWFCLGNSAIWKGKISDTDIKEAFSACSPPTNLEYKEFESKQFIDEDLLKVRTLVQVPWSTMNIDLAQDGRSVDRFRQMVSGKIALNFSPEEIIHAKFMNFDGKVYGFTPMIASMSVISSLGLIKDNNGFFFQNGGVPDWMFILPQEQADSPNHQLLVQVLSDYKETRNKHGNLIFTGEVNPIALNKWDKDMEFRQMAIYYTGVLATAFNMPIARIASIIGGTVKQPAASQDLSEAGYWRTISCAQDYWEDLLNTQLFEPEFGVWIKFNKGFKNDQIKEAQRDSQALQVANDLLKMNAVNDEYVYDRMMIPERFRTGKKLKPLETQQGGFNVGQGNNPSNQEKFTGEASQAKSSRKKNETENLD